MKDWFKRLFKRLIKKCDHTPEYKVVKDSKNKVNEIQGFLHNQIIICRCSKCHKILSKEPTFGPCNNEDKEWSSSKKEILHWNITLE